MNAVAPALDLHTDPRLDALDVIARGATRVVVVDPEDPHACLKFELAARDRTQAGLRESGRRLVARLWPRFCDNATELQAYRSLHARLGDGLHHGIARVDTLTDTGWGRALRCGRVRGADGSPSASLDQLLRSRQPLDSAALCAALDRFGHWLVEHRIALFDLNAGNLLMVRDLDGYRVVCIDCKSVRAGKELVPVSRWIPALGARKIHRRLGRLKARITRSRTQPTHA